jgi:hypothetical protein
MGDMLESAEYLLYLLGIGALLAAIVGKVSIKGVEVSFDAKQRWGLGIVGVLAIALGLGPRLVNPASAQTQQAFADLETELELDNTTWKGEYQDVGEAGAQTTRSGFVTFHQSGSRITGDASAAEASRKWLIEGVAYKGRLCYIYVDNDPNVVSIGTSCFELEPSGDKLVGYWTGWSPDGSRFEPRRITLTKVKH